VPYENQKEEKKVSLLGEVKSKPMGSSVALRKSTFTLEQTAQGDFFTYETLNGT